MDTARSQPSLTNLSQHSEQNTAPMPLPTADSPTATESTRPILFEERTRSLSGPSGRASSRPSDSGPNSLHMANPTGTSSMTDTRQNFPGSDRTSVKSSS